MPCESSACPLMIAEINVTAVPVAVDPTSLH
jgi:hypothetical protein